jgi:hypothetical protein
MDESAPAERPPDADPGIADGVERHLDSRALALSRAVGWIVTGCILTGYAIAILILLVTPAPTWVKGLVAGVWLPLAAGLAWLTHRWPEVEHRHVTYKLDELGIEIRRGVVWRSVVNVPRSRVQHTDVSQGPIERRFRLGTLKIHTAGTESAEVDLEGLDHTIALRMRDHLVLAGGSDAV